jgi:hypothetical protein
VPLVIRCQPVKSWRPQWSAATASLERWRH